MKKLLGYARKDPVLVTALVLAVISMAVIHPDQKYIQYIDFRTLGILFGLMAIVGGMQQLGVFDRLAERVIRKTSGRMSMVVVLVMLCFVSSMLITNDVALITFVPFAMILLRKETGLFDEIWILRVVVMQTIAANLGSMLTPVGNPQNLYLFGLTRMGMDDFIRLMLPYSLVAFVLLIGWIGVSCQWQRITDDRQPLFDKKAEKKIYPAAAAIEVPQRERTTYVLTSQQGNSGDMWKLWGYMVLFGMSLLVVGRMIPWYLLTILVFGYVLFFDRKTLQKVDYSLLITFLALFLFIGNLGRMEIFRHILEQMLHGRERITAVAASQIMSNVPAAILLSDFTDNISELIVGTNLGGLGTLIASMASLISFKYIAKEYPAQRGRYLAMFTVANVIFLFVLIIM